jgi:hypothetical protein
VVDGVVGIELREGGGHDALPSNAHVGAVVMVVELLMIC